MANERVKPVIIRDKENNKEYTLEFNRETIKFAEGRGFRLQDVDDFPMTKMPELFWLAFRMHHPSFSLNQAEKLLEKIGGMSSALAGRLGELYSAPFKYLMHDEEAEKNPQVEVEL